MSDVEPVWNERAFGELSAGELYAIVMLRERVFVVEQKCVYLDADGIDPASRHLWATYDAELVAYLRIVPAGVTYPEASLGRVIVSPRARGTGLGKELMRRGIAAAGSGAIRIAAQAYVERFYAELGFHPDGGPFDEDGIAHIMMVRPAGS